MAQLQSTGITGSFSVSGSIIAGIWEGSSIENTYISGIDQNLLTTSSPTFAGLTVSGATNSWIFNDFTLYGNKAGYVYMGASNAGGTLQLRSGGVNAVTFDTSQNATFTAAVSGITTLTQSSHHYHANNTWAYWADSVGSQRRIFGLSSGNDVFVGPVDASWAGGHMYIRSPQAIYIQPNGDSGTWSTELTITENGVTVATGLNATLVTAAQPNVTSLGTLTGLGVSSAASGTLVDIEGSGTGGAYVQIREVGAKRWYVGVDDSGTALNFREDTIGGTAALVLAQGGAATFASDLTLASGSITSASGAISFGNENLSTTGTWTMGNIIRAVDTSYYIVSGGDSTNTGANISLYGGTHATQADDLVFRASGTNTLVYDDSASSWNFQANAITTTGTLSAGATTLTGTLTLPNATYIRAKKADASEYNLIQLDSANRLDINSPSSILMTADGGSVTIGVASAASVLVSSVVDLTTSAGLAMRVNGLTTTAYGQTIVDGGVGVSSSGTFHVRQKGDLATDGIAITSSHADSHRIWKDASGHLYLGPSSDTDALQISVNGALAHNSTAGATFAGNVTLTNASASSDIYINGAAASESRLNFYAGGAAEWQLGRNAADNLFFYNYGTSSTSMTLYHATGDVGVAHNLLLGASSTSSNAQFYATKTYSNASGTDASVLLSHTQSVATTGGLQGVTSIVAASHTSGTVASVYGTLGYARATGAGGTTTSAYGGYFRVQNLNASATITNAYGLYIDSFAATGTITNRWGVYQAGASENNYFAGAVRVGTTSAYASEKLRVDGGIVGGTLTYWVVGGELRAWAAYGSHNYASSGFNIATQSALHLGFGTNNTERLRVDASNPILYINDTANANMSAGLTINQGANDDEILALKSSDVAHGYTSATETDTFFTIAKYSATAGGSLISSYVDSGNIASFFNGFARAGNTTKTTAAQATIMFRSQQHDGAGSVADMDADANVFAVQSRRSSATPTVFIIDEDGDYHYDGADGGAFDAYEDAKMVRAFSLATSHNALRTAHDDWVKYNEQDLIDIGVLGAPVTEGGLINGAQLQRLHTGAIWQNYMAVHDTQAEMNILKKELESTQLQLQSALQAIDEMGSIQQKLNEIQQKLKLLN